MPSAISPLTEIEMLAYFVNRIKNHRGIVDANVDYTRARGLTRGARGFTSIRLYSYPEGIAVYEWAFIVNFARVKRHLRLKSMHADGMRLGIKYEVATPVDELERCIVAATLKEEMARDG